jgi:hypothetical protein
MNVSSKKVLAILKPVLHKVCWHVSVGGCTLPSFSLALGGKAKRNKPLLNLAQPAVYRKFEPEISFFVWCAWRLERGDSVVTSDNGDDSEITRGFKGIIGKSVTRIEVTHPVWDLVVHFSDDFRLMVFCNQVAKKESLDNNWQATVQHIKV